MTRSRSELFDGRAFSALLFDMDGTLLDSMLAVRRVWGRWAVDHGLDPETLLSTIHGVRAADTIRRLNLPGVDVDQETARIAAAEIADVAGVTAIEGASAFISSLPASRWAIVTSAPRDLAWRRLEAAGLPRPALMVTAEDVAAGKPDPHGYLLAADKLGVSVFDCLIFEDAEAGVQAAEAAGSTVVVITDAHPSPLQTPHLALRNFSALRPVRRDDGRIGLVSTDADAGSRL